MVDPNMDDRHTRAAQLRMAGLSYAQIATQLGYANDSGAYDAVQSGFTKQFNEPTTDIRRLEIERLDVLLTGLWAQARRGDVTAIDRVLKVMERRSRYLGLDSDGSPQHGEQGDVVDDLAARRNNRRSGTTA